MYTSLPSIKNYLLYETINLSLSVFARCSLSQKDIAVCHVFSIFNNIFAGMAKAERNSIRVRYVCRP